MGFNDLAARAAASAKRLDEQAFLKFSTNQSSALDRTIVPLGRAADSSRLWMIVAGVLALAGGRRSRRAALRGLLSVAVTSALINSVLKPLLRRRRPVGELLRYRFGRQPTSSSFPSGHTASAAAFATGVALELPPAGAPLAVLAAGVGASRVYAGVHYPGDAVAGALAGTAIAMWLRRFWPVASREPAQARAIHTRVTTTAAREGEGIAFVVNPWAGPALSRSPLLELEKGLPRARLLIIESAEEFEQALEEAGSAAVVGIAGGDGSVNAAAQVAVEKGKPLVVVPAGTLNHLARDLGIDSVADTIEAVSSGRAAAVDVASIDGKVFLNTASFGSYVELVDAREKLEGRIGKWPSVLVALTEVLRRSAPVEVEIDGASRSIWMIFIGNCRYHPSGFAPSWRDRLDDGLLDVRIVDAKHPWARTRLVFAVLSGTLGKCRVYEHVLLKEMKVRSADGKPMRLARDGETFQGSAAFSVHKLARPLPIYIPEGP
ncbi:MAG: bifunctional phosphatase PAP2/diacylglycerol kinase family protein [Actinomycetota bacterium]